MTELDVTQIGKIQSITDTSLNNTFAVIYDATTGNPKGMDVALLTGMNDDIGDNADAISDEVTTRGNADTSLADAISDEVTDRKDADTLLGNAIGNNTADISTNAADILTKEPSLPDTPDDPEEKFLNGNRQWSEIALGSGGYAGNLYFTNVDSDVSGYKKLSYTNDETETELSAVTSSSLGEVIAETFLFDEGIGIETIPAGKWNLALFSKVSGTAGTTNLKAELFLYHLDGTETVLDSQTSAEISTTTYPYSPQELERWLTQYSVLTTDRMGIRFYAITTATPSITVTTIVGDGRSAYLTTPLELRHNQLRGLNEDSLYQHVTQVEKDAIGSNTVDISTHVNATEDAHAIGAITGLQTKLDAQDSSIGINTTNITTLSKLVKVWATQNAVVGFIRYNGDADPDALETYGTTDALHTLQSHFHMGVIKNGVLVKQCKDGYLTVSNNGETIAIDGSEGDVMCYTDVSIYKLNCTTDYNGEETNLMALSLIPFTWQGKTSKEIKPFAFNPQYTVNTQIGDDIRSCAHSVYDSSINGTYAAATPFFNETYKANGGGYFNNAISGIGAIQQAQNKNADALTNDIYMGMYYEYYEIMWALMFTELGTLTTSSLDSIGVGCTLASPATELTFNDTAISGNTGVKIIVNGAEYYLNLFSDLKLTVNSTSTDLIKGIDGAYYTFTEMLEMQRVLDKISKSGLIALIGVSTNIFTEDAGIMTLASGINLSTGDGMVANQKYYVVRNIPNCQGLADGVMTAVINTYVKLTIADGVCLDDDTLLTGGIAILKFSRPIYMGMSIFDGCYKQSQGAYYIIHNSITGEKSLSFKAASDVSKVPALKSFGIESYEADESSLCELEKGLDKELIYINSPVSTYAALKSADYNYSLFTIKETGGSLSTYEATCIYAYLENAAAAGKKQVHGSVFGRRAGCNLASVRFADCNNYAAYSNGSYAGAFAIPELKLSE